MKLINFWQVCNVNTNFELPLTNYSALLIERRKGKLNWDFY